MREEKKAFTIGLILFLLCSCGDRRENNIINSSINYSTSSSISNTSSSSSNKITSYSHYPVTPNKDYSYQYKKPNKLPSISIFAESGNDFATVPDREYKWDYIDTKITVDNCEDSYKLKDVPASVKVRGNWTANYDKKPFRIKFDKKQKMLGLNKDISAKSWVLLADYKDSSMLRNALSFYLGNTILRSDGYYCSDFIPINLYINNTYWGMYLLCEQQQVNKYRINIDDVDDRKNEDNSKYTGTDIGYFFEYDGYYEEETEDLTFVVDYHNSDCYKSIKNTIICPLQKGYTLKSSINSDEQLSFISNYMNNLYNISLDAIANKRYKEFDENYQIVNSSLTNSEDVIDKIIDIDSLVDTYLLQEIVCDADIAWSSFFMSLDMSSNGNKKLTFQAPWDFDSSLGLKKDLVGKDDSWFAATSYNPWMSLFMSCDWFQDRVRRKWDELMGYNVFPTSIQLLQDYSTMYEEDYKNNFTRWPNSIGWNSSEEVRDEIKAYTTEKECATYLINWYQNRIDKLGHLFFE